MKFVNSSGSAPEAHDSRRDIHLTGVATEMTSGTTLMRRVVGERALYSEDRGYVQVEPARIETYREEGGIQGATMTDKAMVYLADQETSASQPNPASSGGRKGNMEFVGNFVYRTPSEKDPTTDTMTLVTYGLVWDEEAKVFRCPHPYRMVSAAPGKPPMVLKGKQFIATRDLQSFTMGGGSLTNNTERDAQEMLAPLGREIQQAAEQMAAKYKPLPIPTPLVVETTAAATGYPAQSLVDQAELLQGAPVQATPAPARPTAVRSPSTTPRPTSARATPAPARATSATGRSTPARR